MNVAVLTLTRERLSYTRHCFERLRDLAGCDYDHFVLDQGSRDGTAEWLRMQDVELVALRENVGCCRGWNVLVDLTKIAPKSYDVLVCFDNDCELTGPETLRVVAGLASEHQTLLSPRVLGLRYPPPTLGQFTLGEHVIDETAVLGNIFMAIPAGLFEEFRFDESNLPWAGGEAITSWYRSQGGRCGYVRGFECWHYRTTDGQVRDYPWYFARRVLEGGPAR